jgi:hypothetical protein
MSFFVHVGTLSGDGSVSIENFQNELKLMNGVLNFRACANCVGRNINDCFKTHCVTADGIERGVLTINRQIPGPGIHVNYRQATIKGKIIQEHF